MSVIIALLVLAVLAFFLVKYVLGKSSQQDSSASTSQLENSNTTTEKNAGFSASQSAESSNAHKSASGSLSDLGLNTGDMLHDVREMIKILNLAPSDASRLSISRDTFSALRGGDSGQAVSADELRVAAEKLRHMLA